MNYNQYQQWRDTPVSLSPHLSVVIPTYNEAARIIPTIAAIAAHLAQANYEFEIVVSDDGSTDGTARLVRNLGFRNVVVLDPQDNNGKGAAIRAGVNAAKGGWILISDADLSTPIEEVDRLLSATQDCSVVIGSRTGPDTGPVGKSRLRKLTSRGARLATRLGLGLQIRDTQCGFKLFERHAARDLFSVQRIDGFSFDAEVLFLAKRLRYRVREVSVQWFDAPGSTVCPFRASLRFLLDLLRIRLRAGLGRYPSQQTRRGLDPMDDRIRLAIVTAVTPSTATLAEYGQYLVTHLAAVPEVSELLVLAECSDGVPSGRASTTVIPCWRFNSLLTPLRIVRSVRKHRPDAVLFNAHFTSFGANPVTAALGLLTPAVLSALRVRNVVLLHNLVDTVDLRTAGVSRGRVSDSMLLRAGRLITRLVLRSDRVVTTMPRYVDILRERYGADNVALTPHASFETVPLPEPDRRQGQSRHHRVLTFGRFGTYKKVDLLIEAVAELRKLPNMANTELIVAGTDSPNAAGYLDSVKIKLDGSLNVTFTGYVEEPHVATLFRSADVVVFPYSATTGSSGPLHQAGTYGKAVIAPLLGDFIQLITEEGFDVETFQAGEVSSLVHALHVVLSDHDRRREMEVANHTAASSLPMSDIAEWHIAHVETLLGQAQRARR